MRLLPKATAILCLLGASSRADVIYDNTANPLNTGFQFNGAKQVGNGLVANVDVNELTLIPGAVGMKLTGISFLAFNPTADTVVARPTIYVWAANGAGNGPGTLLADFVLGNTTFAANAATTINYTPPPIVLNAGEMHIWAGIGFDDNHGTTGIGASDLGALGAMTYHPADVGSDGPQAYYIASGGSFGVSNPSVVAFGTPYGANYGWRVTATAVPEPSSLVLLIGMAAVSLRRRGRRG